MFPAFDLDTTGSGRPAQAELISATGATLQATPSLLHCLGFDASGATGGERTLPDWLCIGTSPSVEYRPRKASSLAEPVHRRAPADVLSLSVPEQLQEAQAALSLNRSLLAQVLRISRPTLYEWLEGNSPNVSNTSRLSTLLQLLQGAGINGASPLNSRFVRQPHQLGQATLVELLAQEPLNAQAVLSALMQARRLGEDATQASEAREERLRALGFDGVSDQQRQEQLDTTISLLMPPK